MNSISTPKCPISVRKNIFFCRKGDLLAPPNGLIGRSHPPFSQAIPDVNSLPAALHQDSNIGKLDFLKVDLKILKRHRNGGSTHRGGGKAPPMQNSNFWLNSTPI